MKAMVSDPCSRVEASDPVLFPTNSAYAVAITCIVAEMLFSTVSNVLLRLSASQLAPELVLFLRLAAATLILATILLFNSGARQLMRQCCRRRRRLARYVLCAAVGYLASLCWLYAVLRLPLAVATSLFFTTALFMGGMARWVLREPLKKRDWIGLGMGLGGVALVLRPSFDGIRAEGVLAALIAAGLAALALTLLKSLSGTETPATSALLRLAPAAPLAALPAIAVWSVPSWAIMTAITVASVLLILGQAATAKGYGVLSLAQSAALEYVRLIFATGAGILVFSESVGGQTLLGGAAIVAAALLSTRKDRRAAVPSTRPQGRPAVDFEQGALDD
jgi:drug/metabolite transporter (DMT)-like permease